VTRSRWTSGRARSRIGGVLRRWVADRSGATLVQFVMVLPILVLVLLALFSVYSLYSARQSLCEAVYESARYLQVEGPLLAKEDQPDPYPEQWRQIAFDIINSELKSNTMSYMHVSDLGDVEVNPPQARRKNKEMDEVTAENVALDWFFVRATVYITNPLGFLIEGLGDKNRLKLSCQGTGFYEIQPIGPTPGAGGPSLGKAVKCPPVPLCTPGLPPTEDPDVPTPTCPPCRQR
jgi:hypothetical protein